MGAQFLGETYCMHVKRAIFLLARAERRSRDVIGPVAPGTPPPLRLPPGLTPARAFLPRGLTPDPGAAHGGEDGPHPGPHPPTWGRLTGAMLTRNRGRVAEVER